MRQSIKTILKISSLLPGFRTNRKLVIIESDDWGTIRMPSKKIFNELSKKGFRPEYDPYLKYDSLATESDLIALFSSLNKFKDFKGKNPVLTANCIQANPDFDKIKSNHFNEYKYESFRTTLSRYKGCEGSFDLWKEGINEKIFVPQFHGREHVNVHHWMMDLKNSESNLRKAFDHEMISISSLPSKMRFGYMEALDYFDISEIKNQLESISKGYEMFKEVFGIPSSTFIANCYIWHPEVEKTLVQLGVKTIQSNPYQLIPKNGRKHFHQKRFRFTGQLNKLGMRYSVRNAYFEPSILTNKANVVDKCLDQISLAFLTKKPAIICSHRLNFIGAIEERNRSENLQLFENLIKKILIKWPDVEFISSSELSTIIHSSKNV